MALLIKHSLNVMPKNKEIDQGSLEEAKPIWNKYFMAPKDEQLLFECTGKVLDSRGVFDVHIFLSTKFLSILIDNSTPYLFPLKNIVCWCKAVKDIIQAPPYVKLKPIPNQPGKPVPPGMPSAIQIYTKDERIHMFFDLSVHCDLLCYMVDFTWKAQTLKNLKMSAGLQKPKQVPIQGTLRQPMHMTQMGITAMGNAPLQPMAQLQTVPMQQQQQYQLQPSAPPPPLPPSSSSSSSSLTMQQQQHKLMIQQQKLILQQQQLVLQQLMMLQQSPDAQQLLAQQQQLFQQQKQLLDNQLQLLKP